MTTVKELTYKVNHVISSRFMKTKYGLENHFPFPTSDEELEEVTKEMIFIALKHSFPGAKIRTNASNFSVRFDGVIQRNANKIREVFSNDREWRQFFENKSGDARDISRTWNNRRERQFEGFLETTYKDGKAFAYIPYKIPLIQDYQSYGLVGFLKRIEEVKNRDEQLARHFVRFNEIMQEEIERKETEYRLKLEAQLAEYKAKINRKLYSPISKAEESDDPVMNLFAQKYREWAKAEGVVARFARQEELTPDVYIHEDLKVRILAPEGSEEEGWIALPPFEGYQEPEGYIEQGWGSVSRLDFENPRSRGGVAPVVVQEYLFVEQDFEHWKHLIPEDYEKVRVATARIMAEAREEIEPFLEEQRRLQAIEDERRRVEAERAEAIRQEALRLRREREEAEQREREERARQEHEEQQRREREERRERERLERMSQEEREREENEARQRQQSLLDALRAQIQATPLIQEDTPTTSASEEQEEAQLGQPQTTDGVYYNPHAIPLESYVSIIDGHVSRFASAERAIRHSYPTLEDGVTVVVRNYYSNQTHQTCTLLNGEFDLV